jgi:hypothetical protein
MKPEDYKSLMSYFIQTAQVINQLTVGALILPIIFIRDILGISETESMIKHLNTFFYISWFLMILTIGFSISYQTLAAKRIEQYYLGTMKGPKFAQILFRSMFISFFCCILFFLLGFVFSI